MASQSNLSTLKIKLLDSIAVPRFVGGIMSVQFNPTDYTVERNAKYAEVAIPGLDAPVLQWVRGNGDTVNLELFFDATDSMVDGLPTQDLRGDFVTPLELLMVRHPRLHRPPRVAVWWGKRPIIASAVVQSLSITYNLFDTGGTPIRATARLGLRQHTTATRQILDPGNTSPDLENTVTVREGDTLPAIAQRIYHDATKWRVIARANGLSNPLALTIGQTLRAPRVI